MSQNAIHHPEGEAGLESALNDFQVADREYHFQRRGYDTSDAAIGDVEWARYHDAALKRNEAFRELMRHALGLR